MTRTYQNAVCDLCMMNAVMFISCVDMELKGRIREAIIKMILDFDIGTVQQKNKAIMAGHDLLKSHFPVCPLVLQMRSLWLSSLFFDN